MRQVKKRWYVLCREFNKDNIIIHEEFEGSFKTKEEAIAEARIIWDYLTDEEKRYNSIHACMYYQFQDDNGEWHSIFDILENTEFMISCEDNEIPTF